MDRIRKLDDEHQETEEEARRGLLSAVTKMARGLDGKHLKKKEGKEIQELDGCYKLVGGVRRNQKWERVTAELDCRYKNIPIDLLPEFFSRLPVKSIGRFKSTSKSWRDQIVSRRFSSIYAKNKHFYTFFGTSSSFFNKTWLVEVSEKGDTVRTDFGERPSDRAPTLLAGSCNGLLCLVERRSGFDNVVVVNPVTDERMRINSSNYDIEIWQVHYRFGYSPSTNEYKVLRCFTAVPNVTGLRDEYDIITVGVDKRWRKLSPQLFPNHVRHGNSPMVPSCKGTFHWIADDGDDDDDDYEPCGSFILAFDIAEENTRRIPIPQTDQRFLRSLVCNDPLCLYYRDDQADAVWKMEEGDGDRWSQIEVPNIPHEHGNRKVDFIASLDCATISGGILYRVEGPDVLRLYCPKSKKYTAFVIPIDTTKKHDPKRLLEGRLYRDLERCRESILLCEITPTFSSINEMISKPGDR